MPRWRKGSGLGWVTAEYAMLPASTNTRSDRESVKGRIGGRTHEISRLIGRSLRAVIDYKALGENTIVLDCDVLQADGGTRTAAITGAYVALADACAHLKGKGALAGDPLTGSVAAVSVGIIDGEPRLDLPYEEDVRAETDMNVVMTGEGKYIEIQGTAEADPFDRALLDGLLGPRREGLRRPDPAPAGGPARMSDSDPGREAAVDEPSDPRRSSWPRATPRSWPRCSGSWPSTCPRSRCSGSTTSTPYDEPAETEPTFEGNALLKARVAVEATGSALARRRLRAVRGRAQRDARGAVGALVRPCPRTTWRTTSCCSTSWPTSPTSGAARTSRVRSRSPTRPAPAGRSSTSCTGRCRAGSSASCGARAASATTCCSSPTGMTTARRPSCRADEKDAISHRGQALREIAPIVVDVLVGL